MKKTIGCALIALLLVCQQLLAQPIWTAEKANAWYKQQGWLVGCNYIPNTAINQLECWQADSFDTATINKELGWAQGIGFNVIRVYLHDLAWEEDPAGFKSRMDQFLGIANRHHIKVLFTIFDDCWNPDANTGKQPDPRPGIHNSGWVRSPSLKVHNDSSQWGYLQLYVKDILSSFKNDQRILLWDLYNEPGNSNYNDSSLALLKKVFEWAWSVRPSQPLSSAPWYDNKLLTAYQLDHSDVITFHNYNDTASLEREIRELLKRGKPVICTEYMARTRNSRFESHLPIFKKYNVGAINWGFVSGKTNTIYQWGTPIPDGSEPKVWFHDIFRKDGTPYDSKETAFIKNITSSK